MTCSSRRLFLGTITARTLIVFGDSDPLYPLQLALELRQSIPRSALWVVPNGGDGPVFGPNAARFVETTTHSCTAIDLALRLHIKN